ncbi:hypothetical protein ACFVZJ_21315 [Streptomyces sp. NPDC058322]|uniref:hypothetical protein n=1 Tax=Streptomyces sp. NPDC058322 TaxID=3346446 RepID=UPI0036E12D54
MTTTAPATTESILARYAADIAVAADEKPATTLAAFAEQLVTAAERLGAVGINGSDDLETAATYLADADGSTDVTERDVLLNRAVKNLAYADEMADEYRLMV